jgi:hypothetical protein
MIMELASVATGRDREHLIAIHVQAAELFEVHAKRAQDAASIRGQRNLVSDVTAQGRARVKSAIDATERVNFKLRVHPFAGNAAARAIFLRHAESAQELARLRLHVEGAVVQVGTGSRIENDGNGNSCFSIIGCLRVLDLQHGSQIRKATRFA